MVSGDDLLDSVAQLGDLGCDGDSRVEKHSHFVCFDFY